MIGALSWAAAANAACGEDPAADAAAAAEIHAVFAAGEAETAARATGDKQVAKRDEQRAGKARGLAERACDPAAKMELAWLMLQADDVATLEQAHALAVAAMQGREKRAYGLVPATYDVLRVAQGAPQRYGTQFATNVAGRRCLVALEAPPAPEDERARYGLAPLADTYRQLLVEAGFPDDEATVERLDRRGLVCAPAAARH